MPNSVDPDLGPLVCSGILSQCLRDILIYDICSPTYLLSRIGNEYIAQVKIPSRCRLIFFLFLHQNLLLVLIKSTSVGTHNIRIHWPRWLSWMLRPTGDQEVAGSTPAEVGNILSWRLIVKYFLRSFSPFC